MTHPLVDRAWHAYDRFSGRPWCVTPSAPILFFGDLHAYRASPLRVVTVGLNPSWHEFRDGFRRFPLAEGCIARNPSRYLDAMSAYFRTDPYRTWFNSFERLLNGMATSYYDGHTSTALHTDICSPVATSQTWSTLDKTAQKALMDDGCALWHMLLKELKPQIVAISVREEYLNRITFAPITGWKVIRTFNKTRGGKLRALPYEVRTRWYEVAGERSLFAFGAAAQTPFGKLAHVHKREAGEVLLGAYGAGFSTG